MVQSPPAPAKQKASHSVGLFVWSGGGARTHAVLCTAVARFAVLPAKWRCAAAKQTRNKRAIGTRSMVQSPPAPAKQKASHSVGLFVWSGGGASFAVLPAP